MRGLTKLFNHSLLFAVVILFILSSCSFFLKKRNEQGVMSLNYLEKFANSFEPKRLVDLYNGIKQSNDTLTIDILQQSLQFDKKATHINISIILLKLTKSQLYYGRQSFELWDHHNDKVTQFLVKESLKINKMDSSYFLGSGYFSSHFCSLLPERNKKVAKDQRVAKLLKEVQRYSE